MEEEIAAPKGSVLEQLQKEDLSLKGLEELEMRVAVLQAEIARAEAMRKSKQGSRSDAEALFSS